MGNEPEKKDDASQSVVADDRSTMLITLRDQYRLRWEKQRELIKSSMPLTEAGTKIAVRTARSFLLPLHGIDMIPVGKGGQQVPYVNAEGIRFKLWLDPRGYKSSDCDIIHWPTKDEPWVVVKGKVEFADGSVYHNFGAVDCQPGPGVSHALLKSKTKAYRRAGISAVGVALPVAEEYYDYADEQRQLGKPVDAIDVEYREAQQRSIIEPKNLAELLAWIEQVGHTTDEAVQIAGEYAAMAQDILATVKKLKGAWNVT